MTQAACALVLVAGLAACGDDEEAPEAISQEEYDEEAQRLCDQHGEVILRAYSALPDSDAEEAAYYTTDLIPRTRAMIRGLVQRGLPADQDAAYRTALNEALAVLDAIGADPYRYIDERHRQETPPEEDLLNRLRVALAAADVPCLA